MKKVYKIDKSRLYAQADYSAVLRDCRVKDYKLSRINTKEISVYGGEVCFFDPYNPSSYKPFTVRFRDGKYLPFSMLISTTGGDRVAFGGLDGGLNEATEWRLAFTDERDVVRLNAGEIVGTVINSGFGCICSRQDYRKYIQLIKESEGSFHPLDGAVNMEGSCCQLCNLKGLKLFVFNTGWGEGRYSTYLGFAADGELKGLIGDFGMVKHVRKPDCGITEDFEIEVSAEEVYIHDPKKSDAENGIIMHTSVIENTESGIAAKFNAYSRRGYAYHTSNQYDNALADYLRAIRIGKENPEQTNFIAHAWPLYDNAASICCDLGKTEQAIALYTEAKSTDSFYGGAYSGLIDIYRDAKSYEKALEVADEMVAVRPKDPISYLKRSEIYMACEEYEKAISDLNVLINTYKLNESILDKALCMHYLNNNEEALRVLDTYLLEGRASEVYYNIRADICLADNDFSSAYNAARNAFDVNPDYPATLEKLISLDGLLLNYKNVVRWASRYIMARPRTAYGYIVRADAYLNIGEYDSAVEDCVYLVQNIEASPRNYGTLVKTALIGNDVKLAKKYTKLLRKTDNAYYIYAVGLMLLYQKKYSRARRYLASALAINGDDVISATLVDYFIDSGDYANATAALNKYAQVADGEAAFIKSAKLILRQGGATAEYIFNEYVKKFLGGCEDKDLLEKAERYFKQL